jgi:hypothetical protein
MLDGGWSRPGDGHFEFRLRGWPDAREPLAAAMQAALTPFLDDMQALDLSSPQAMTRQNALRRKRLTARFLEHLREPEQPSAKTFGWLTDVKRGEVLEAHADRSDRRIR